MQTSINSFQSFAEQFRPQIETALGQYAESTEEVPARLAEAIQYSLLAPGKRLRPLLVLMAARACGDEVERAMPAAAAVEMIHAYSLIHDDLPAMDDDDLRRGRPTCHKAFDEATAILAGDALLTLAFETVARLQVPSETVVRCVRLLAEAAGVLGMVGGQADDIYAERGLAPDDSTATDLERLKAIHYRKTGAIIRVSLELGAVVAGATPDQIDAMERYGQSLGMAFQITDDLLDVCGDEARIGKRVGKDEAAGKLTFPALLGVEQARSEAERLVQEASEAVALLGEPAEPLVSLAFYVLKRDH
ncbi:MAG: polyprenyl synthetase family protein [Planctomycetia bacterium]|jgi:geranylgeranyl diphosphate synthase type II